MLFIVLKLRNILLVNLDFFYTVAVAVSTMFVMILPSYLSNLKHSFSYDSRYMQFVHNSCFHLFPKPLN